MSRYKYTKLKNLSPLHGFLIYTPDDRTLKDLHPQFIVRELNRLNERIKRLEEAGDAIVDHNIGCGCGQDGPCRACRMACEAWTKAKEAKP